MLSLNRMKQTYGLPTVGWFRWLGWCSDTAVGSLISGFVLCVYCLLKLLEGCSITVASVSGCKGVCRCCFRWPGGSFRRVCCPPATGTSSRQPTSRPSAPRSTTSTPASVSNRSGPELARHRARHRARFVTNPVYYLSFEDYSLPRVITLSFLGLFISHDTAMETGT